MKPLERLGVTGDFPAAATCRGLTMHVRPGEIVGLLGADGAGKTTLIRLPLGLAVTTEAAVTAFGRTPDRTHRPALSTSRARGTASARRPPSVTRDGGGRRRSASRDR
ncbi:ATP-binding cassette domain-containing protein [Streptomyces sp. NPDC085479]|uniref:ATP-binding cassette domain-containing protein n=1 Tax=Streptomyces sp. NPDC085479 TaxID=3365726 RepID=UPI0037CDF6BD